MFKFLKKLSIQTRIRIMFGFFLLDLIFAFVFFVSVLSGVVFQVQARAEMEATYARYLKAQIDLNNFVITRNSDLIRDFKRNIALINESSAKIWKHIKHLKIDLPELTNVPALTHDYHRLFTNFVQQVGTTEEVDTLMVESSRLEKKVTRIFENLKREYDRIVYQKIAGLIGFVSLTFGLILLLSFLIGFLVMRSITRPVKIMLERFSVISGKEEQSEVNLDVYIDVDNQDELGKMASFFNAFVYRLNRDFKQLSQLVAKTEESGLSMVRSAQEETQVIRSIEKSMGNISENVDEQTSGVEEVSSTLEEMVRNIDHIAGNIERQSASVNESAGTIEEMSRNIEKIAENSAKTKETSRQLSLVAQSGGEAVKKSMFSIKEVAEYSNQILKLLKLITDIAKQTNLLAMNASIEAAHAGDAGKGFAIVADEIRRLSESTNKSARDIQEVVNTIVEKINDSANLSEQAEQGLEKILSFANQTEMTITELNMMMEEQNLSTKEILGSTQLLVNLTEEIRIAMSEQKNGVDEFGVTMNNLKDLFIETRDEINEHLSAVQRLVQLVNQTEMVIQENQLQMMEMNSLLNQFKLAKSSQTGLKLVE